MNELDNVLDEIYDKITELMIEYGTDLDFNLRVQEVILDYKKGY